MYRQEIEIDRDGGEHIHHFLTRGDSLTLYDTLYRDCEELLNLDLVKLGLFKLSDSDYKLIFEKELEKDTDINKYILRLTSDETKQLGVNTYIYELEYTLLGGEVSTTHQWKFTIENEITDRG